MWSECSLYATEQHFRVTLKKLWIPSKFCNITSTISCISIWILRPSPQLFYYKIDYLDIPVNSMHTLVRLTCTEILSTIMIPHIRRCRLTGVPENTALFIAITPEITSLLSEDISNQAANYFHFYITVWRNFRLFLQKLCSCMYEYHCWMRCKR